MHKMKQIALSGLAALAFSAAPAFAQNPKTPYYDQQQVQQPGYGGQQNAPQQPGNGYQQQAAPGQGFSFQGDEMPPSHDRRQYGRYDDRYSQTYQQQQAEAQRPGGGCLRYGAVGAAAGHLAGHGVLGALAGCVAGRVVRNRDRSRIDQQSGQQ